MFGFLLNLRNILKLPMWPGDDIRTEATSTNLFPLPPHPSLPFYSSILEQEPCVTGNFSQSSHDD